MRDCSCVSASLLCPSILATTVLLFSRTSCSTIRFVYLAHRQTGTSLRSLPQLQEGPLVDICKQPGIASIIDIHSDKHRGSGAIAQGVTLSVNLRETNHALP